MSSPSQSTGGRQSAHRHRRRDRQQQVPSRNAAGSRRAVERDPHTGGPRIDAAGRCSIQFPCRRQHAHPVETAGWCWRKGGSRPGGSPGSGRLRAVASGFSGERRAFLVVPQFYRRRRVRPVALRVIDPSGRLAVRVEGRESGRSESGSRPSGASSLYDAMAARPHCAEEHEALAVDQGTTSTRVAVV